MINKKNLIFISVIILLILILILYFNFYPVQGCIEASSGEGMSLNGFYENIYWENEIIYINQEGRFVTWGEKCSEEGIKCHHYWFGGMKSCGWFF